MSLDDAIERAVIAAVEKALAPYLRRLGDPEPLVYSVPEAAQVLRTSTNTIRRMVDEGVLPTVPHMGQRVVIPRVAVVGLVESGTRETHDRRPGQVEIPRTGTSPEEPQRAARVA